MNEDDKAKRTPRQNQVGELVEAKPPRSRKAKNEINLDDALRHTRDAAFLAGGAGGKDLSKADRGVQMRIARGVAAGMIAAEKSLVNTAPRDTNWQKRETDKRDQNDAGKREL